MRKRIKLFDPYVGKNEEIAIKKTLKSHFWASGAGIGKVLKFEEKFNKYIGSDCCVSVNSGTAALHLALSLINIKNKEVILPSLSFVSTAHAVIYNGGKPVFVDVDPETLCIDPHCIRQAITRKTKVILPVHYAGLACKLDEIKNLCKEFNLLLIEDAAHAAGASYKNKKIGSHGTFVCFSFHPVKNLAMPTGGAITLNGKSSSKFRSILKSKRWCGISNRKGFEYDVEDLGWNFYMNEFSAAIGIEQLKKLDKMNSRRRQIAKFYSQNIELDKKMPFNKDCAYHLYWILVKNRNNFIKKMNKANIEVGIHYKPIHEMSFYKNNNNLPNTKVIGTRIVTIPMHPNVNSNEVSKIVKSINEFA